MKLFCFILPLLFLLSPNWLTSFDEAKTQAKEKHQYILLNFSGSDWCAPCIRMKKEVFETQAFNDFATENLVLLKADFPRQKKNQLDPKQKAHNESLADKFNPNGKFPLTVLLDSEGKVVHEWDGYAGVSADKFITEVRSLINAK
jgi:thioredoxin-related protein